MKEGLLIILGYVIGVSLLMVKSQKVLTSIFFLGLLLMLFLEVWLVTH
jgi:hypothetical protein